MNLHTKNGWPTSTPSWSKTPNRNGEKMVRTHRQTDRHTDTQTHRQTDTRYGSEGGSVCVSGQWWSAARRRWGQRSEERALVHITTPFLLSRLKVYFCFSGQEIHLLLLACVRPIFRSLQFSSKFCLNNNSINILLWLTVNWQHDCSRLFYMQCFYTDQVSMYFLVYRLHVHGIIASLYWESTEPEQTDLACVICREVANLYHSSDYVKLTEMGRAGITGANKARSSVLQIWSLTNSMIYLCTKAAPVGTQTLKPASLPKDGTLLKWPKQTRDQ